MEGNGALLKQLSRDIFPYRDLSPGFYKFEYNSKGVKGSQQKEWKLILREADTDAGKAFRNSGMKAARYDSKGKPIGVGDGGADSQYILISKCLFEEYTDEGEVKERLVPDREIRTWPDRVTQWIFQKLARMSGMVDELNSEEDLLEKIADLKEQLAELREAKESGKNSQSAMTSTSE